MAKFTIIEESAAPEKVVETKQSANMIVSQQAISGLKPGKVASIGLDEGDTVRGMKASLSRAASKADVKVITWDVEGVVYVKLAS